MLIFDTHNQKSDGGDHVPFNSLFYKVFLAWLGIVNSFKVAILILNNLMPVSERL